MDNNSNNNQDPANSPIDPSLPPALDADPASDAQAAQNPAAAQAPQVPQTPELQNSASPQVQTANIGQPGPTIHNTGVSLESPILGPTHFDGMTPPDPVIAAQLQGQAPYDPNVVSIAAGAPKSNEKFYMTLSIVFGALAFIGIVVGIWSLVSNIATTKQLDDATVELNRVNAIVAKVQSDTGKTITTADDVPDYTAIASNIYIEGWGIKFRVPDDLTDVSYVVDQKYRPEVCFSGYQAGVKYFPSFADIDQNTAGLGCITRVATYEGEIDKETGLSFGQKIYTYGDYSYFYNAPKSVFSTTEAEQGLESTAVQIIKNMLSNNISHFE